MLVGTSARSVRFVSALVAALALVLSGLVITSPTATAADCTPLSDADMAFGAPRHGGTLDSDPLCLEVDEAPGTVVQVYLDTSVSSAVAVDVTDAAGKILCEAQNWKAVDCTLSGTGPFRVQAVHSTWGPWDYEVQVRRITDPIGCSVQGTSPFGDPGDAALTASIPGGGADCRLVGLPASTVAVNQSGLTAWTLYDQDGSEICSGPAVVCEVSSSGQKTLVNPAGSYYAETTFTTSLVPLDSSTPGCGPLMSTSWSQPSTTVAMTSRVQVDCHRLDASVGDRIVGRVAGRWGAPGQAEVVDDSGDVVCTRTEGYGGCVLEAEGPYRLVSYSERAEGWTEYTMSARNLTTLEGCPTIAPSAFGTEPDDSHPGAYCRQFEVREASRFLVVPTTTVQASSPQVFTADGRYADCASFVCDLEPGRHAMTFSSDRDFTTVLNDLTDEGGCGEGGDSLATRMSGTTLDVGYECYLLPSPSGSTIAAVRPIGQGGPRLRYFDAEGQEQCPSIITTHEAARCALEGTAPFRVLVKPGTGDYRLAFTRLDSPQDCTRLAPGAFGSLEGEELTLDADAFARCFVVPEADYTGKELFAFARSSGSDAARLFVTDTGWADSPCLTDAGARGTVTCWPNAGGPSPGGHTVVLMGEGQTDSTYKVVRRQLGAKASCEPVASTSIGGPATQGTISDYLELDCYTFDADPKDTFFLNLHTTEGASTLSAYRPDGGWVCSQTYAAWCRPSGHSQYQVVVGTHNNGSVIGDYELEPMLVGAASGLPLDGCVEYDDYSTGFGPLDGTLDSGSPSACITVRDSGRDTYGVSLENTAGEEPLPLQTIESIGTYNRTGTCSGADGVYECTDFAGGSFDRGMLLLFRPDGPDAVPYRLTATCASGSNCGDIFRVTGASPMTAPSATRVTVSVEGGRLQEGTRYKLVRDGHEDVVGTAVSGDVHARDVEFDLAGVEPGEWRLDVVSTTYGTEIAGTFEVTPPHLTSVELPEIRGGMRVDDRVRAYEGTWSAEPDSFTYQWQVNGEDIDWATYRSLRLRPWMRDDQVTVVVTAHKDGYVEASATSAERRVYPALAPRIVERPRVKGIKRAGRWVRVTNGVWDTKVRRYTFRWFVDGHRVRHQNHRRIRLRRWMVGKYVRAQVIAHRPGYLNGRAYSFRYRVRR